MSMKIVWFCEQGRIYKGPLLGSGLASLFTVIVGSLFNYYTGANIASNFTIWVALVVSAFFLTWWTFSTDRVYKRIVKESIKSKFKKPKIGIISPNDIANEEIKSLLRSTDYTPDMWVKHLSSDKSTVEKTSDLKIKSDFAVLVNPFGELYPEEDTLNLKTFQAIKEFIRRGGVFVNTAGLAFFYMWNPKTKIEGLTGTVLEGYSGNAETKRITKDSDIFSSSIVLQPIVYSDGTSLIDTWLYKNFGIRTSLGEERSLDAEAVSLNNGKWKVHEFRSALRCENPDCHLIPIVRSEFIYQPTGKKHECYPIAAVKYGHGYLILVGLRLKSEGEISIISDTIKKIIDRLAEKGCIE
jgi:hypothetical protein